MQTFYSIGIQIEFKNPIVNISKSLQISFTFSRLFCLIAFCNIHTNTLELCLASLVDTFCDPSEHVCTGSVTTKQSHISSNRSI